MGRRSGRHVTGRSARFTSGAIPPDAYPASTRRETSGSRASNGAGTDSGTARIQGSKAATSQSLDRQTSPNVHQMRPCRQMPESESRAPRDRTRLKPMSRIPNGAIRSGSLRNRRSSPSAAGLPAEAGIGSSKSCDEDGDPAVTLRPPSRHTTDLAQIGLTRGRGVLR